MNHSAIALYLGESYATLRVFDLLPNKKDLQPTFEKSVYLPQTSLKNLLLQTKGAVADTEIKSIFIVTRYMDRLKTFRLGGSVVQVVPKNFENSYSLSNTQVQSLAAPALIFSVSPETDHAQLVVELTRLKKINPEINKVVFQLPEDLFSSEQIDLFKNFFTQENFKIFTVSNPYDLESVRKTLLNAGSEGTKEEILSEIKEALGETLDVYFWIQDHFSKTFESLDLYFSSHCFLQNYLQQKNLKQGFYFDFENWNLMTTQTIEKWHSPWGTISYSHPKMEEFTISPYCELTVNSIGQLIVSKSQPQFEPGPIVAGRSVKTLILDVFSDELKSSSTMTGLFPQILSDSIQQKVTNQFQILSKAQSLDSIRLSREEIKSWLRFSVLSWITQKLESQHCEMIGDFAAYIHQGLEVKSKIPLNQFSWMDQIQRQAQKVGLS